MLKYILLSSIFFIITFIQAENTTEFIKNIPLEEQKELECLFYNLVNDSNFGYTLFGDKPVSIASYFKITPWENFIELGQCDEIFWQRWKIWEKYRNRFHIQNYLLLKEDSSNVNEIFFINKKSFLDTLINHLDIFEAILKKKISPQKFLADIEERQISFYDSIQNNEILLGILLGYGKHNSFVFYQRQKILNKNCLNYYSNKNQLLRINSLCFMVDDNHHETKSLKEKYQKLRGKLSVIYAKGNFLEITLAKLTSTD